MATSLLRQQQHHPVAASTSSGSRLHSGEVCVDLYTEHVMIPRVVLLSVLAGLAVVAACMARRWWHNRCRWRARGGVTHVVFADGTVSVQKDGAVVAASDQAAPKKLQNQHRHSQQDTQLQKWVAWLFGAGLVWTAIFLLSFQSYDFGASNPSGASLSHPRVVFSFTTIAEGITKLQPALDALVEQEGKGFDAIYVIVPRVYRKMPVEIPPWLVADIRTLNSSDYHGIKFATGVSAYHEKVRIILLDMDFGPASKVLGTLLVEHDSETIIVYGDDDRIYPPQLCERALHYSSKFPNEAIAVLGGWISAEDSLYCGRSLEVGINRVSFVGGAGGVVVKRKFFGVGEAVLPAFKIANFSKACFLGDDYYLSHLLSKNGVPRRLVYDSCWSIENLHSLYYHTGLSRAKSSHPGGANVEHYQQCIRELGFDQDLSGDGEFGWLFMAIFSRTWGVIRGLAHWLRGDGFVAC